MGIDHIRAHNLENIRTTLANLATAAERSDRAERRAGSSSAAFGAAGSSLRQLDARLVSVTVPRVRVSDRLPVRFQRVESGCLAVLTAIAFVDLGFAWWWLLALFLVFDLSMVGYASSPRLGAWTYNIVHSHVAPAALGVGAVVDGARWAAFLSLVWAFHIAVDRLLGYGLKFQDRFTHTHLGEISGRRSH